MQNSAFHPLHFRKRLGLCGILAGKHSASRLSFSRIVKSKVVTP